MAGAVVDDRQVRLVTDLETLRAGGGIRGRAALSPRGRPAVWVFRWKRMIACWAHRLRDSRAEGFRREDINARHLHRHAPSPLRNWRWEQTDRLRKVNDELCAAGLLSGANPAPSSKRAPDGTITVSIRPGAASSPTQSISDASTRS